MIDRIMEQDGVAQRDAGLRGRPPVEGVWSNLKYHRLANHGIDDVAELHDRAEQEARVISSRPDLLRGFVRATPLPIRLRSAVH